VTSLKKLQQNIALFQIQRNGMGCIKARQGWRRSLPFTDSAKRTGMRDESPGKAAKRLIGRLLK